MSKRDWKILFEDILDSITKIESYTKNLTFVDFSTNPLRIDTAVSNIEMLGEASKNISQDVQQKFNDIPWQKLNGIRNRIVHEYFQVDISIIWFIIQNELAPLKESLLKHLNIR
jgi:uncharacterized protein with HEPN domain